MATRTLLFDLARLDGVDTTSYRAQVQVSLLRPQQDNETTVTTVPLPVAVDGPTRVDVPVTAPGNALAIQWPPGASLSATTYHLIPPGDGNLLAADTGERIVGAGVVVERLRTRGGGEVVGLQPVLPHDDRIGW